MRRPDEETLAAMVALTMSPEWQAVRAWLADSQSDASRDCETLREPAALYNAQGEARTLREIIEQFDNARQQIRELRKNIRGQTPGIRA